MLSVIIPTLNEEKYIGRLLTCIRKQCPKSTEIIVSDGSSSDRTVAIAKACGCRVVVQKRQSPAIQRNAGAAIAKGDVLLFLDADTMLPELFFDRALKEFDGKKLDVGAFFFTLNSNKLIYRLATIHARHMCYLLNCLHPFGFGAGLLVRKRVHDSIGGFDETILMGEDHVYCLTVAKRKFHYNLIRSTYILFSTRRFEKEGFLKVALKWYYFGFYYVFRGPIRKLTVPYEFGKY